MDPCELLDSGAAAVETTECEITCMAPSSEALIVSSVPPGDYDLALESTAEIVSASSGDPSNDMASTAAIVSAIVSANTIYEAASSSAVIVDEVDEGGSEGYLASTAAIVSAVEILAEPPVLSSVAVIASTMSGVREVTVDMSDTVLAVSSLGESKTFADTSTAAIVSSVTQGVTASEASQAAIASSVAIGATVTLEVSSTAEADESISALLEAVTTELSTANASSSVAFLDPYAGAFWSNTETMAAARWSTAFNSYAQANGLLLAADETGVHVFGADTDAGAAIVASIRTDEMEFSRDPDDQIDPTTLKRLDSMYLYGTAAAPLTVKVRTSVGQWSYLTHHHSATEMANLRAKMGRGLVDRHAEFTLTNEASTGYAAGAAFDVKEGLLALEPTLRRI